LGEVVKVSSLVEEGCGKFEESDRGTAKDGESGSVGVGEDLEEEFGREARQAFGDRKS
jgi:hypothetical protein